MLQQNEKKLTTIEKATTKFNKIHNKIRKSYQDENLTRN